MKAFFLLITLFLADGSVASTTQIPIGFRNGFGSDGDSSCAKYSEDLRGALQESMNTQGSGWPIKLVVVTCSEK